MLYNCEATTPLHFVNWMGNLPCHLKFSIFGKAHLQYFIIDTAIYSTVKVQLDNFIKALL